MHSFSVFLRKPRVLALMLATIFALTICWVGQLILRTGADDPQIQMAEDTAIMLANGFPAESISATPGRIVGQSLSPFTVIYDANGDPVSGTAYYRQVLPNPPKGVFVHVKRLGGNRITWQPEPGIRFAAVIAPYHDSNGIMGYVMVARDLREVERRIDELCDIAFYAWIASVFLIVMTSPTGVHHVKRVIRKRR